MVIDYREVVSRVRKVKKYYWYMVLEEISRNEF